MRKPLAGCCSRAEREFGVEALTACPARSGPVGVGYHPPRGLSRAREPLLTWHDSEFYCEQGDRFREDSSSRPQGHWPRKTLARQPAAPRPSARMGAAPAGRGARRPGPRHAKAHRGPRRTGGVASGRCQRCGNTKGGFPEELGTVGEGQSTLRAAQAVRASGGRPAAVLPSADRINQDHRQNASPARHTHTHTHTHTRTHTRPRTHARHAI
jgi:hypothetical protein